MMKKGQTILALTALVAGIALAGTLKVNLSDTRTYKPAFALTDAVQKEVNTSAFARILGETRASLADFMWVKTERYLDRGVAYAPHIDENTMTRSGKIAFTQSSPTHKNTESDRGHDHPQDHPGECAHEDHDHDHNHDQHDKHEQACDYDEHEDSGVPTLIPTETKDYRGFVGRIHRAIHPWQDPTEPHNHTSGDELLPWYRLLTYANPHHWRGYMVGSWWLMKLDEIPESGLSEATRFIEEGIANNPDAFQLRLMHGRILIQLQQWTAAVEAFQLAADLALRTRPESGELDEAAWTESDEEDFRAALRYVPLLEYRKLNDPESASLHVEHALNYIPNDRPLLHLHTMLSQ